jgi:hypothetical protein
VVKAVDGSRHGEIGTIWLAVKNGGAFTRLRSAVNQAIAPLEIDHINFEPFAA